MSLRFTLSETELEETLQDEAAALAFEAASEETDRLKRFDISGVTNSSPAATFVPEYYEPNYAYPILIWLHDDGGSERDLLRIMPEISNRNYFGFALRGPLSCASGGYRWSQLADDVIALENELFAQVGHLQRKYNLHSERIFIGGQGAGGALAMRLNLRRPEWFAGVVSISGRAPQMTKPLAKYRQLPGKRALLAGSLRQAASERLEQSQLGRLLHTAGVTVSSRLYETSDMLHRDVIRDIDRWMMQECYRTVAVD